VTSGLAVAELELDEIDWVGDRLADPTDPIDDVKELTDDGCGGYWYGSMLRGESWKIEKRLIVRF
jgi:hypothetical protein